MSFRHHVKSVSLLLLVLGLPSLGGVGGYLAYLRHSIAAARQPYLPQSGGSLVICGGGSVPEDVRQCFVDLAGGSQARLAVIPSFDPSLKETAKLMEAWRNRGVASVVVLHATSCRQCDDPDFVRPLTEATGVWLSGGQQSHLSARVSHGSGTPAQALLARNGVIGGSSAGAAAMSRVMIGSGIGEAVEQQGFDLVPGMVIDQHVLNRNRMQRLLGILKVHPGLIGLARRRAHRSARATKRSGLHRAWRFLRGRLPAAGTSTAAH